MELVKYQRTPHIEGSRLQEGDEDLAQVKYKEIRGRWIVVEEKFDGSNSAISFPLAELKTQSRGHYLDQGIKPHFKLFNRWADTHQDVLFDRLHDRFIMFGEWMLAKHSIYYDQLPHYFLEFDIWDRSKEVWLDTPGRRDLLGDAPILPVAVLYEGVAPDRLEDLVEMINPSLGKTPGWKEAMMNAAALAYRGRKDFSPENIIRETEVSHFSEGLFIKVEEDGHTVGRLKFVRNDFVQAIKNSETHWDKRPVIANKLAEGVDIYAPVLTHRWEDLQPWISSCGPSQ